MENKDTNEEKAVYPICPECGNNTLVGFTPPKENMSFLENGNDAIDWNKAHLYCCNGDTNCKFSTRFIDLVTPMSERKYNLVEQSYIKALQIIDVCAEDKSMELYTINIIKEALKNLTTK